MLQYSKVSFEYVDFLSLEIRKLSGRYYLLTELVMHNKIQLERMKMQTNILKIFYQDLKMGGKCLHEFENYSKDVRIMSMVKLH